MNRVVITGIGVVSPIGTGKKSFRDSVKSGKCGIRHIPELASYNFNCEVGGLPDISQSPHLQTLQMHNLGDSGTTVLYALVAGLEAWEDAGFFLPDYNSPDIDPDTGVIVGSGIGSMDIISEKLVPYVKEGRHLKIKSSTVEQLLFSSSSAYLSGLIAAGNFSTSNSNACSTGTEAIVFGYEHIKQGKARRMLAGSTEGYSPYYWAAFDALRVTATKFNHAPEMASRPMSASSCGMVPAAGAGIILLEDRNSALERGARIYCEISGGFVNSGGQRNGGTMTAPNSAAVVDCIKGALNDASISAGNIDCISGHLSSTKADVVEIKNWAKALGLKNGDFPFINSLKSMTGHCLGAAGSIESIAAIIEISENFIHRNINCEDLHPEIAKLVYPDRIPGVLIEGIELNHIAKTSFGFGDVNACLILSKHK